MKYRLMNPDGSPTELVYDDLFRATYMVNMLSHWTQTHLGIQSEEGQNNTQSEMHFALCEWMGWKKSLARDGYIYWIDPQAPRALGSQPPPITLDWLHEVARKLSEDQTDDYWRYLENMTSAREAIDSTREQRLEALCHTLFPKRFKDHEDHK